jgi:NAD(P)-dependent dehydrogenase (short-subunit alcohol dehydrogenase family)
MVCSALSIAIVQKYGKIIPIQGDVTSRDSLISMVSTIKSQTGYINLLMNKSRTIGHINKPLPHWTLRTALRNSKRSSERPPPRILIDFRCQRHGRLPHNRRVFGAARQGNKHGGIPGVTGQVITTASLAGFRRDAQVSAIAYHTSKAAAIHLGKTVSSLLKDWQIVGTSLCAY